jgi:hypothetical protein
MMKREPSLLGCDGDIGRHRLERWKGGFPEEEMSFGPVKPGSANTAYGKPDRRDVAL